MSRLWWFLARGRLTQYVLRLMDAVTQSTFSFFMARGAHNNGRRAVGKGQCVRKRDCCAF